MNRWDIFGMLAFLPACYALDTVGIGWRNWQFYVVLISMHISHELNNLGRDG